MRLDRGELRRARDEVPPELRALFDKAIADVLDVDVASHRDEKRMRKVAFYLPVWIFAGGTVITIVLIVLATLKLVQLDDKYLNILVKAFIGEMVGAAVMAIRRVWRS